MKVKIRRLLFLFSFFLIQQSFSQELASSHYHKKKSFYFPALRYLNFSLSPQLHIDGLKFLFEKQEQKLSCSELQIFSGSTFYNLLKDDQDCSHIPGDDAASTKYEKLKKILQQKRARQLDFQKKIVEFWTKKESLGKEAKNIRIIELINELKPFYKESLPFFLFYLSLYLELGNEFVVQEGVSKLLRQGGIQFDLDFIWEEREDILKDILLSLYEGIEENDRFRLFWLHLNDNILWQDDSYLWKYLGKSPFSLQLLRKLSGKQYLQKEFAGAIGSILWGRLNSSEVLYFVEQSALAQKRESSYYYFWQLDPLVNWKERYNIEDKSLWTPPVVESFWTADARQFLFWKTHDEEQDLAKLRAFYEGQLNDESNILFSTYRLLLIDPKQAWAYRLLGDFL